MAEFGIAFRIQETARFFDRAAAQQLDPVYNRYFRWVGANIRSAARKSLKVHRKKVKELTASERQRWQELKLAYKEGRREEKPTLPKVDSTAKAGDPPHLNFQPNPLRDGSVGILFTLDDGGRAVVIGPSPFKERGAEAIEDRNPFMAPALTKITPRMPALLKRAAN